MANIIFKTVTSCLRNLFGFTIASEHGNYSQLSQPVEIKKVINFVSPFDKELEKVCKRNCKEIEKANGLINVESHITIYILALRSFSTSSKEIKWSKKHYCDELSLVLDVEVLPENLFYRSFSTKCDKNYYHCNSVDSYFSSDRLYGDLQGWSLESQEGYYLIENDTIFFVEKAYWNIVPSKINYQRICLRCSTQGDIIDLCLKLGYCFEANDIVVVAIFYETFLGKFFTRKIIKTYSLSPSQQEVVEDLENTKKILFI